MSMIQRMTQLIQRSHAEASATINTAASRRQRGASATEYAIIVALVAIALTAAFGAGTSEEGLTAAFEEFLENVTSAIKDGKWPGSTEE